MELFTNSSNNTITKFYNPVTSNPSRRHKRSAILLGN